MRWLGSPASPSRLNLALQGGGAHGAFTWGVLDALLEDARIRFEGLSGSSAGAMNAVVLADGWIKAGREDARQLGGVLFSVAAQSVRCEPASRRARAAGRLPATARTQPVQAVHR